MVLQFVGRWMKQVVTGVSGTRGTGGPATGAMTEAALPGLRIGIDGSCWANRRGYGRFTRELLCALRLDAPCPTFRPASRNGLVPPPQAPLIARPEVLASAFGDRS